MKKKIISAVLILSILPMHQAIGQASTIKAYLFPVKFIVDNVETNVPEEYALLNYNNHVYVPIRYVSEKLGFLISYDKDQNSIFMQKDFVLGPSVSLDQAKLVAYETYHIKTINKSEIRMLDDKELKNRPADEGDLTPVYYIIDAEKQDGSLLKIYVSSNKATHNFIL